MLFVFFFSSRRRHTRCLSDWSSDVCSSDLELPFVSVIDCRGEKRFRSYYTKWHELGHLLILTDQMRLTFRRTHFGLEDKDPEEALVDVIAGAFGFLPDIVRPLAKGQPSFDGIEDIRIHLCP